MSSASGGLRIGAAALYDAGIACSRPTAPAIVSRSDSVQEASASSLQHLGPAVRRAAEQLGREEPEQPDADRDDQPTGGEEGHQREPAAEQQPAADVRGREPVGQRRAGRLPRRPADQRRDEQQHAGPGERAAEQRKQQVGGDHPDHRP